MGNDVKNNVHLILKEHTSINQYLVSLSTMTFYNAK